MSLRRALTISLLLHLLLVAMAGVAVRSLSLAAETTITDEGEETLVLNLVDPAATELGDADLAPPVTGEGEGGTPRRGAMARAGAADGPDRAAGEPDRAEPEPATVTDGSATDPAAPLTATTGEIAAATVRPASRTRAVVPGRLEPRELAALVGLETEGLDEAVLQGMFSAMHKYALQQPQPAASTYRQLLRAWIDGLMGYPYPVLEHLARNVEFRFIGGIRIEVDADGSFRLADLWLYPGVQDPGGVLAGYYRRVIRDATAHRFLPPADARLPAPHGLEYRIVNPRARR